MTQRTRTRPRAGTWAALAEASEKRREETVLDRMLAGLGLEAAVAPLAPEISRPVPAPSPTRMCSNCGAPMDYARASVLLDKGATVVLPAAWHCDLCGTESAFDPERDAGVPL